MRSKSQLYGPVDVEVILLYMALVFIGWISIFSSSYDGEGFKIFDLSKNYGKQLLWIGVSGFLFITILVINKRVLTVIPFPIYLSTIILLGIVFVVGKALKGDANWIDLGFFKLQPSEFAKLGTALALAKFLSLPNVKFSNFRDKVIAIALIGLPALMILAQGDAGSFLVYIGFAFVLNREGLPDGFIFLGLYVIFISVLALVVNKYILIGIIALVFSAIIYYKWVQKAWVKVLVVAMVLSMTYSTSVNFIFNNVLENHQRSRINVILGKVTDNSGAAYNLNQSKIAIGSGGFFGKGWLHGTQTRYDFVPELSTDFIFCVIGEEFGFFGVFVLISVFVMLLIKLLNLAERQNNTFNRVYMYSVVSIIFMHLLVNIGMTIGLLPVIGIPLPLISYGGSSMLTFSVMIAIAVKLDSARILRAGA
ncbi:MAG: rod shape-determining protein RodA [Bacteroidetes bacterium]|nr:rod shape-determining protein RodA [Bacteroidota bacterium]MBP7255703.1 rod shape-determining protein RodA [Chitinophagales bacterium]MBK7503714.1 rod shape-determining protein RodA [Bacteroidota bacterium]MBK8672687.1 rod shape-determining protein RodA [Bacteroidota bacterium]MBK9353403.1 rod shape-determining protein RodA [Bacteroidota bacterium]